MYANVCLSICMCCLGFFFSTFSPAFFGPILSYLPDLFGFFFFLSFILSSFLDSYLFSNERQRGCGFQMSREESLS